MIKNKNEIPRVVALAASPLAGPANSPCRIPLATVGSVLRLAVSLVVMLPLWLPPAAKAQDASVAADVSTAPNAVTLSVLGKCQYSQDGGAYHNSNAWIKELIAMDELQATMETVLANGSPSKP